MIGRGPCRRHRDVLAALAEGSRLGPDLAPDGRAALEHTERCDACATLLGELMLTAMALRRMGAEAADRPRPTPDDAWTRLRARLLGLGWRSSEPAWRGGTSLSGLALSMLLVVTLVGPSAVRFASGAAAGASSDATTFARTVSISAVRNNDGSNPPSPGGPRSGNQIKRSYPDGNRPDAKEVPSARAIVRPTEPR